jgi:hypothetical protein
MPLVAMALRSSEEGDKVALIVGRPTGDPLDVLRPLVPSPKMQIINVQVWRLRTKSVPVLRLVGVSVQPRPRKARPS